jgi:hypothetical protein
MSSAIFIVNKALPGFLFPKYFYPVAHVLSFIVASYYAIICDVSLNNEVRNACA